MTRLRRKLNSMFCNKVNFIFTRELSYSCCGNHHFESLDFGAFKFSATGLHTVAYFAWTFNLLHNVAWLPWTWKSCQKLTLQPHDFPSLLPFPSTYNTVQRNIQGAKMISHFILKLPAWGEVTPFRNTESQAMSTKAGNVIAFMCSQDSHPRVFLDLRCIIQYTWGDLWKLQVLALHVPLIMQACTAIYQNLLALGKS